ncbi:tRNA (adenosine(37)-N6)-threonylcarbamoyltransferase complex dimerization subunit type 1 TsaB [Bacteroidia bacterium]|nr:tRNA (adenosine(37)-N6)-threonylcarbamoyltransferase complex dimerization subunit type 1 TsaB [Bacteroidia bacterium]
MTKILCIESAESICSVALAIDGKAEFLHTSDTSCDHAKVLAPFISQVLSQARITANDLDAVAVSKGPGSYTSLRIGVSTAKGLCFAAQKPLIAIGTLDILASMAAQNMATDNACICAMLDARRMEVYAAFFDAQGKPVSDATPVIVDEYSFMQQLSQNKVVFVGSGAQKCSEVIHHPNAVFVAQHSSAIALAPLAQKAFEQRQFENTAYFEPFYLKSFVATQAKNKFSDQLTATSDQ